MPVTHPVTSSGLFYKGVSADLRSPNRSTGKLTYTVGSTVEADGLDKDPWSACGAGVNFHRTLAGALKWGPVVVEVRVPDGETIVDAGDKLRARRVKVVRRAYLAGADLSGAYLAGAYLSRANLSRANLAGADLSRAYLAGADLSRANLSRADLSRAYLSGAYLAGADLSGADLSRANLSRANLSGATYTQRTLWPEGFDPQGKGLVLR